MGDTGRKHKGNITKLETRNKQLKKNLGRKKYRGNGGNVQYVDREIALNTDIINLTVGTKESKQI